MKFITCSLTLGNAIVFNGDCTRLQIFSVGSDLVIMTYVVFCLHHLFCVGFVVSCLSNAFSLVIFFTFLNLQMRDIHSLIK